MVKRPPSPKARTQRIADAQKEMIVRQLGWDIKSEPKNLSEWVAFSFCLALETTMRRGELLSFTWGDLYLKESYVHLERTKNGEERDAPLSSKAKELLNLLTVGKNNQKVIPIEAGSLTPLFRRAKLAVGLSEIGFYDARREVTTKFADKLSNVLELSAVTGHKDIGILKKVYYQPNPSDLAKKLDK